MPKTALYRMRDEGAQLLYVGISCAPISRLHEHTKVQPWFDRVASITLEWFATEAAALAAEKTAISTEGPECNIRPSRRTKLRACPVMDRLDQHLKANAMTQAAFAERVGIGQSFLSRLIKEPGKRPSLPLALRIASETGGAIPVDLWAAKSSAGVSS